MHWLVASLLIALAYLIGSIPFGFLVARWRGINILELGSKNIGATNVGRVLGPRFGMFVFVLDFAKGAGPVALAALLRPHFDDELWSRGFVEVAAGLAAFLGHMFPIYLRFHGGKGVATGAGAVAVLLPIPMVAGFFVWFVVVCASRYVSLASILAVVVLAAVQLGQAAWSDPRTWFCLGGGALVIIRHRANIGRLVAGTESQLRETFLMHQLSKSLHVLALGLWFGASVFFTVVALSLFGSFETLAQQDERKTWFDRPEMYQKKAGDLIDVPKEQGTRAAGYAVGPMFLWYFALQGVCGFIALATALPWPKFAQDSWMHKWRVNLLLIALVTVLIGWPLEQHISALREPRNQTMEAYLQDRADATKAKEMQEARAEFIHWHQGSLLLNFATIVSVTAAMALAGNLPNRSATVAPPS